MVLRLVRQIVTCSPTDTAGAAVTVSRRFPWGRKDRWFVSPGVGDLYKLSGPGGRVRVWTRHTVSPCKGRLAT